MIHEPAFPSIQAYLERALQLWEENGHLPDADELRQIAADVQMSPEASEAADARSLALTEEARQALAEGEDEGAEELLRLAALLSPVRLQPHYLLAELYGRYYRRYRHEEHRIETIYLAQQALTLAPEHTPAHALLEEMGVIRKMDGISWRHAAMIVLFLVFLSGSMSLCVRYTLVPDVPEEATERVRQHFEEQAPPPR